MGKRKREDDEEYLMRKIKQYEDKLRRKRKRQNSSSRSSSSRSRDDYRSFDENYDDAPDNDDIIESEPEEVNQDQTVKSVVNPVTRQTVTEPPPPVQDQSPCGQSETNEASTTDISAEILELLGQAKKLDPTLGEKIPNEIAERWGKILLDGLAKEQKETLREKMLVPENFLLVQAPKLNLEVASILSDAAKNRDKNLETAQNQLGTGIAGLVNLTKDLIRAQSVDKLDVLKRISEISQLLLDLHHEETLSRRKIIVPLLDKNFWNVIKGVKRDEFLFGTKLGENIRNSKDIEKSSLQIKRPTFSNTPANRRPGFQAGNARGPPRRANNASAAPATGRQQPQPSTSSARRTNNPTYHRGRHTTTNKTYDKKNRR